MDDKQFRLLLEEFGLSWKGYRKVRKGIKKRIRRHMQSLGLKDVETYMQAFDKSSELKQECYRLMSVSVSRFFRDRGLWQILENQILPDIIKNKPEKVRIWSAGCACGEEVYSFMILWNRLENQFGTLPEIEMLATDINPVYLDKAQKGIYPASSLKELSEELKDIHFESQAEKNLYVVAPYLKKGTRWEVHDLLSELSDTEFHIIFLRNGLLTYYQDEPKVPAFQMVIKHLTPGGFLIIGTNEKLPPDAPELSPYRNYRYIFKGRVARGKPDETSQQNSCDRPSSNRKINSY